MQTIKRSISLLLAVCLLPLAAAGCASDHKEGELVINEIMSRNASFLTDADGNTPDWVELYNAGQTDAHLNQWYLSDNDRRINKYALPDVVLRPGEYRLVYCDGRDIYDSRADEIHACFSLSSEGEKLSLVSRSGKKQTVTVGETLADVSYGRVQDGSQPDGTYRWFAKPSPGSRNGGHYSDQVTEVTRKLDNELMITEYCASNAATLPLEDGGYYGFVTVRNRSASVIRLSDYALSDDPEHPEKWRFPQGLTLMPGKSLRVICSGHNETDSYGNLHTSFRLDSRDRTLLLCIAGQAVQTLALKTGFEGILAVVSEQDGSVGYARLNDDGRTVYDTVTEAELVRNMRVVISEISASGGNGAPEDLDWVELYNPTDTDLSLRGWQLRLDDSPQKSLTFGEITLPAGGYRLVYCAPSPKNPLFRSIYAPFKLSCLSDRLTLTDPDGITADIFTVDKLTPGVTCGRRENGTVEPVYFRCPTPEAANAEESFYGYADAPLLNCSGGYVSTGTAVSVVRAEGDAEFRYTTDGSLPDENSPLFNGISITGNTVLRIRAFRRYRLPSDVTTATFLTEKASDRDLPVVCLACAPDDLFSQDSGIFAYGTRYSQEFPYTGANFWQDWERQTNFEYYVNGRKVVDVPAGVKVFGQFSRAYPQKSMALYFRDEYGVKQVDYPFFENSDHTVLRSLVLRASGQDQNYTRIRDDFAAQVMKGNTSVVLQDWQPVAVYINGAYWGYYSIREKINEEWLTQYAGVDGDNLDLLKGNGTPLTGSRDDYQALLTYVRAHDLSQPEAYAYVCRLVDTDNLIDYLITEIFFVNEDSGNIKFYRERSQNGQWRWILFDMDMTLRGQTLDGRSPFDEAFDPAGHGWEHGFSTLLRRGLLKNPEFRQKFIRRFAELLNTTFQPDSMQKKLDSMAARIDREMPRHCERWGQPASYEKWRGELDSLRHVIADRRDTCKQQLIRYFRLSDEETAALFPQDAE